METTTLPVVRAGDDEALWQACLAGGLFYLVDHNIDAGLIEKVLDESRLFFARAQEEKSSLSIKKSIHHRGYGLLKNYRDWREQIHVGVEAQAGAPKGNIAQNQVEADYWKLWGPNQWPDGAFRQVITDYLKQVESLSGSLLTSLALKMGHNHDFFTERMKGRPYLLLKAISYLPQELLQDTSEAMHTGVPAHCDWSWLTLLIQDQVGGLEAQDKEGNWHYVKPLPGSIVVNTGELLEIESGGQLVANPHRVINARIDRQRISVPVFINPALDSTIYPGGRQGADYKTRACVGHPTSDAKAELEADHIHKVIEPGAKVEPFFFGNSEYERKERGNWCYRPQCLGKVDLDLGTTL
ncbi:MAG: hypothetical protein KGS72_05690 [Cyanobacteria bacterium REEB67]|nr:hypothetical protein [Cyanobacteria bacterium REEB67]